MWSDMVTFDISGEGIQSCITCFVYLDVSLLGVQYPCHHVRQTMYRVHPSGVSLHAGDRGQEGRGGVQL